MAVQKLFFGRQDDVRGFGAHLLLDERHGDARQVAAERLKTAHQRLVEGAEVARYALRVENMRELVDGAFGFLGTKGLIRHLDHRRLVVRGLDHAIQLALLLSFGGGLQRGRSDLQKRRNVRGRLGLPRPGQRFVGREVFDDSMQRALQ